MNAELRQSISQIVASARARLTLLRSAEPSRRKSLAAAATVEFLSARKLAIQSKIAEFTQAVAKMEAEALSLETTIGDRLKSVATEDRDGLRGVEGVTRG